MHRHTFTCWTLAKNTKQYLYFSVCKKKKSHTLNCLNCQRFFLFCCCFPPQSSSLSISLWKSASEQMCEVAGILTTLSICSLSTTHIHTHAWCDTKQTQATVKLGREQNHMQIQIPHTQTRTRLLFYVWINEVSDDQPC